MANRVKWLVGVGAACVVLTVFIRTIDLGRRGPGREYELSREISRAREAVREYTYIDSLKPLLPAQPGVRVVMFGDVVDSVETAIRSAVAEQLAEIGDVRARAGVFVVPTTMGKVADGTGAIHQVYYAGVDNAGAYCFAVVSAPLQATSRQRLASLPGLSLVQDSTSAPLGPCFYWARYGAPGQQLATWLREGGYRFADLRMEQRELRWQGGRARLREVRMPRRRIFGLRDYSEQSLHGQACLEGRAEQCVRALTSERAAGRPGADRLHVFRRSADYYWGERAFGLRERAMLADVERQFGPERFAQFWRSDADVETAFAEAFGMPMNEWVQQWAITHYGAQPTRAGLGGWTLLLSLIAMGALCGAALIETQRRQVR